ncbi:MAG: isoprenyl transferase [Alphaproteobacteria bacterium]
MSAEPVREIAIGSPRHVAIIMDGNGRWARARGLPRAAGHKAGADAVRRAVESARHFGVRYLTLFGFSSENWKRPADEVSDLMGLLRLYLRSDIAELHKEDIRLRFIGDRSRFSADIVALLHDAEERTAKNTTLDLIVALNYGARNEIVEAARKLAEGVRAGRIAPSDVDEARFEAQLSTFGTPDPDVVIRTSGEQRLSNFLLWQSAYAELVFLDIYWPDFSRTDFEHAIREFHRRERRYGATAG